MVRRLLAVALIAVTVVAAVVGWPSAAVAQSYPERSVRVVENRPGASGNIGAQAAAQSAPTATRFHLGAQTLAVNMTLAPIRGFDPTTDFEPSCWWRPRRTC